jgi:ubiquinone/menaquinone biosynthesis C-methylase UbiE
MSETAASSYDLNAEFWVKIMRESLDRFRTELTNAAVLNAAGNCQGSRLLDAGSGEGYLSRIFAGMGTQVDAIDFSSSLIEAGRNASAADGSQVTYHVGDVTRMGFAADTFDIVVGNHVLNDLAAPEEAIAEFYRVLKPNGRLVILMLHPCFYGFRVQGTEGSKRLPVSNYFSARHKDQPFNVAGIVSPAEVTVYVRPLEYYFAALISAGFQISRLQEPHPDEEQLNDEWWQKNFTVPMFLLITATKEALGLNG